MEPVSTAPYSRPADRTAQAVGLAGGWLGGRATVADIPAAVVTALFSVPESMAYASIAGFGPFAGLCAGIVPTMVGSLLARSVLMVTTLTSAIALTSRGVFLHARLSPADPANVAALTLLVGVAMALFALLRVGRVLRAVSPAAMTGFSVGIAVQIIAGALGEATGYRVEHHNRLLRIAGWASHPGAWSGAAATVAAATLAVWATAHARRRTKRLALLVALAAVSVGVWAFSLPVPLARSLGAVPAALPALSLPAWAVMPRLLPGACAVALVALAQAASISPGAPDATSGPPRDGGRDIVAQAAANVAGAFFQALPVGGSLSRTGVSVAAGAGSRWAGVLSGVLMALIVSTLGGATGHIPLPAIGALLIIIGFELIRGRASQIRAVWSLGPANSAVMGATFLATTELALPQALLTGLILSLALRLAVRFRRTQAPTGVVDAVPPS
ncbi:SulP family inorganic anion transporter [Streptacidiphilus sp. PB12-B1b]|uniref:SulP family inorganic anion transporter n=1 Tax=Streptacidiphilus sp. PB12-B1b TaxID=2705012 RepID=UPI0015FB5C21|nr:SulP family inorganic anion transporter [Streptacidiphilus sp. PB12-B1b]QMU74709.1 SulP family inorganic anion transporter [Streptacidiphilus sp. PB12-B1b]